MSHISPLSAEVRSLPSRTFACVHHVGPFAGDVKLFNRLFSTVMAWARPHGLVKPTQTELITIYHDDSRTTEPDKLRISVGLTVPPGTEGTENIRMREIPPGDYICAVFEIDPGQYEAAWDLVQDELMPQRSLQKGNGFTYECYLNDPLLHPQGKHRIEIRISVKPS